MPSLHTNPLNSGEDPGVSRMVIVDILEHIYGPLIVALGFSYFFAFADPAQEVIIGFLGEVEAWRRDEISIFNGSDFLVTTRIATTIILLAAVPISLSEAARRTVISFGMGAWIPRFSAMLVGGIPFLAIIKGLYSAATSPEAIDIRPFTAVMLGLGLVLAALYWFTVVSNFSPARKMMSKEKSARTDSFFFYAFLLIFGVGVVLVGFVFPHWGAWVGPIGLASSFAIVTGAILAGLTQMSGHMPGSTPLIVLIILTVSAQTGLLALLILIAFALAQMCWFWKNATWDLPPSVPDGGVARSWAWTKTFGPRFVPLIFAAVGLVLHIANARSAASCGTLAGCHVITGVEPHDDPMLSTREAFESWDYADSPEIRIIAAQGGGLYAAYQTAYYLAARADADPDFARSVFALSGVSGGSVGAGIYWAIRASGRCEHPVTASPDCHKDAVRQILRRDYLSPSLAAFFYRDNLDNFLPYSALLPTPIDRGRVLENRFVQAVEEWEGPQVELAQASGDTLSLDGLRPAGPTERLKIALSKSWMPENGAPLLFFNGTAVGDGTRHPLSPIERVDGRPSRLRLVNGMDMTVANAMVISARFPLVTPPARVLVEDPFGNNRELLQLVDGGYFDNSGIETAIDIVRAIEPAVKDSRIEVIAITVQETPATAAIKGTVGAPVSAFTNAWRARIDLTAERAMQLIEPQTTESSADITLCQTRSVPLQANFTVSWYLSQVTFADIEQQVREGSWSGQIAQDSLINAYFGRDFFGPPDCLTGAQEERIGQAKAAKRSKTAAPPAD